MNQYKIKKQMLTYGFVLIALLSFESFAAGKHDHHPVVKDQKAPIEKNEMQKNDHGKMLKKNEDAQSKDVQAALASYEKLHEAFYKNDQKDLETKSAELMSALSAIADKKIVDKLKDQNVFTYLKSIKAKNNLSTNSSLLHGVSTSIFEILVTDQNLSSDYALYACPMVFDDKEAFWIQNTKKVSEVQNPYRSDMPHCGSQKK